jgi:hypothetical protein
MIVQRHEWETAADPDRNGCPADANARLTRECLPVVQAGRHRIAELAGNDSSPEASAELDHLAGKRRWDGSRDPLTSAVEVNQRRDSTHVGLARERKRGSSLLIFALSVRPA